MVNICGYSNNMSNTESEMNGNDDVAERFGGAAQAERDRLIEVANDAMDDIAPYEASISDALDWAVTADAGDYLVTYDDTGMTNAEDPGSRCGYGDDELDAIRHELGKHNLTLTADDRGLVAQAVRS
jgi:hypothetical protein